MAKAPLPFWPAALRLDQSAAYCGLSADTFKELCPVKPIQFTASSHGRRWLRVRLDAWLASLDQNSPETGVPRRSLADRIGAPAEPRTSGKRKSGENIASENKIGKIDEEMLQREWDEWTTAVSKRPLGIRERDLLRKYFEAKGTYHEPHTYFSAWQKLIARGFVAEVQRPDEKQIHAITPAGEAEWLRISKPGE